GEVTEGMVWVTGFPKPASWEIHMPAQECFEAVSVHVPLDFLDAMMATEPELARRGKRMVEESANELGVGSRKQRSLFLKMLQIDADQPGGKLLLESCALELLAETLSPLPDNLTAGNAQISEIVQNVTELVDLKLANPPTVADLAGTLRISESRLKREFIDRTGTSIGAFMTGRRMAAAKDMVSSGLPISRVAAEVGYATPEAFSKAFRRKFGSSPREFRANSR
ncbi:MAG: AraC family transcriptional regulator, partial [Pseudomonadota bacterium]